MLIGNVIVLVGFVLANQKRRKMTVSNDSDASKIHSLTVSLLIVTFSYLIFSSPFLTYMIAYPILANSYDSVGAYQSAIHLWWVIGLELLSITYSNNFLCYCIAGKRFREIFLKMIRCTGSSRDILKQSIP